MNLYFFTEARFLEKDNIVYSHAGFSYDLWQRYLLKFDHVYVVGRLTKVSKIEGRMEANTSPDVTFIGLPYYIGPMGYFRKRAAICKRIKEIIHPNDAYLCRVPGRIGTIAASIMKSRNIPYAVEVVGDPEEALSKTALGGNVIAPLYQYFGIKDLKRNVGGAQAALYVTNHTLQKKYPVQDGVFTTSASNVILNDEHFAPKGPAVRKDWNGAALKMLAVGTLAQLYKAPDIVLKALARVKKKGYNFLLTWCGEGQYLKPMQDLAGSLGLRENVSFVGQVNMQAIRQYLSESDLFIHASRAEGLPRAVIEAMAMGLPCIGSRVAGIPELLSEDALVNADDIDGLAEKIILFIQNPKLAQENAERNFNEAKLYHNDILTSRRLEFFEEIKRISSN